MEKRKRGYKYEFPTRILARAERLIQRILQKRGISKDHANYSEYFNACYNLVQELLLIRLFEANWVIENNWLSDWIEKNDPAGFSGALEEINGVIGVKVFFPDLSQKLELESDELAPFVRELYSASYISKISPPELLGGLLEKLHLIHPDQAPFFTPGHLVQLMVDESLRYLELDHGQINGRQFLILDPSFGSGNFLLGLLRKMISLEEQFYSKRPLFYPLIRLPDLSRSIEYDLRVELFQKHLFGLDLSGMGRMSAIRSLLVILLRGKRISEIPSGSLAFLDRNLAVGDFLIDQSLREQIEMFDRERFGQLVPFNFADHNLPHNQGIAQGGFDLIIGNPPWLSLKGKRGMSPYSPEAVSWLISRYEADSYRPNLFEMFIRRAARLTRENGLNCFIVPDRMAENLQFQPLRQFMIGHGEILRLHFREPFPGVVSDTAIYWWRKIHSPSAKKITVTDARGDESEISTKKFASTGGGIEKKFSEEVRSLLTKIRHEARSRMSNHLFCGVGLIARPGTIHAEKQGQLEQPIVKGENIQRWKTSGNYYFEFHPRNLLGGTVRYSKLTAKERLLVRKTGLKLVAALDRSGSLVEQSAYFLIPRPGKKMKLAMEYFAALINSPLLNFYYRNFLVTNPESTPQLKKFHLDELPVINLNLKDQYAKEMYDKLVALVRKIEESKNADEQKKLEHEINQIVFKLHNLKPDEVKLLSQDS